MKRNAGRHPATRRLRVAHITGLRQSRQSLLDPSLSFLSSPAYHDQCIACQVTTHRGLRLTLFFQRPSQVPLFRNEPRHPATSLPGEGRPPNARALRTRLFSWLLRIVSDSAPPWPPRRDDYARDPSRQTNADWQSNRPMNLNINDVVGINELTLRWINVLIDAVLRNIGVRSRDNRARDEKNEKHQATNLR